MALEDIEITRALPVINGFVQVPPNIERTNQTTDVAAALSTVEGASLENGVLKLPPIKANAWFTGRQLAEITSIETGEPPVYPVEPPAPPAPPAPGGGSGPQGPPTWTSNYDTAEFEIDWAENSYSSWQGWISLSLESLGSHFGTNGNRPVLYNRETQDDFEIQIDWGDGSTNTASSSNIAAQNHQYADHSSPRTITVTSTGNAWPDWHQAYLPSTSGGFIGTYYQGITFQEPPGTQDTYVGIHRINSITSWGGLFTGWDGRIGGVGAHPFNQDSWTAIYGDLSIPPTFNSGGIRIDYQVRDNDNIPDTGFEMPDHVPNTASLAYFFQDLWAYSSAFVDAEGNPKRIPAVETENFGNSVYQITDLTRTFYNCREFIPDISRWRTDNVTTMQGLFFRVYYAPSVDLSSWNTSSLINMRQTFYDYRNFNSDIGNWDTSSVTDMYRTFQNALSFNQDISSWDFSSVTDLTLFLYNATSFSQANYDALLIRWAEQADVAGNVLQDIVTAVSANYTLGGAAAAARAELVDTHGWTITDNGGV